jgi:uncharacterized protein YbjT (DUF2867 family)
MIALIFGASGSAGGSVLNACLDDPAVGEVRAISRRSLGRSHRKLREIRHDDYRQFDRIADAFAGVDTCLYCLGKSVRQVSGEAEYRTVTYDFPLAAADALRARSMVAPFHYISGAGASLTSRFMWARVKAEAERDLIARFAAVCWRPASIDGVPSASEPMAYKLFRPVARTLLSPFRSLYVTGEDIGRAMLEATRERVRARVFENAEIRARADRARRPAAVSS